MPAITFPPSSNTVRVRAIDGTCKMAGRSQTFIKPVPAGFETLNMTNTSFLIDHPTNGKSILFDVGARKDYDNLAPAAKAGLDVCLSGLRIDKDVSEILVEAGIDLKTLDAMIFSHWHWDHVGAPERFPTSVDIVAGPGFKEMFMPGHPTDPDAIFLDISFADREVREISFENGNEDGLTIAGLRAVDYFGDGSFYLLDTPGHAAGHLSALARTTPTTFVFMGGDVCHTAASIRPSSGRPAPAASPLNQVDGESLPQARYDDIFTAVHRCKGEERARSTPLFQVTTEAVSAYEDASVAEASIDKLIKFDEDENVLVCLAHDVTINKMLPMLNVDVEKDLNDWQEKGYKSMTMWDWLNDIPNSKGQSGREKIVDGFWLNNKLLENPSEL